jgi:hypothetical protein
LYLCTIIREVGIGRELARMGEKRNVHKNLVGNVERKRLLHDQDLYGI